MIIWGKIRMKRKHRVMIKQGLKYLSIFVIFIFALFLYRSINLLPQHIIYYGLGVTALIIIVSIVFDWISAKDLIPIFKR